MADIFISYKSEDRAIAGLYAEALSADGVSVWWDPVLRTGETYDDTIERNLREARLVVVLWSPRSVKSKWVRAEATIGERKGALLPALIEACDRPIAFELLQTADLIGWSGDRADARWRDFIADVQNALVTRQAQERAHAAPPPPDALTIETLFWSSIKDGNDAADFEAYAQRYPHGHFVDIARNKLRALRQAPSPILPLDGGGSREAAGGGARAAAAGEPHAVHSAAPRTSPPQSALRADSSPIEGERRASGSRHPAWLVPAAIAAVLVLAGFGVSRFFSPPPAGEVLREEAGPPASSRREEIGQDAGGPRQAGQEFDDCGGANWCPTMVVIPAGSFMMGSPASESGRSDDEGPQRRVSIRQFAVGKFEVTRWQWASFANGTSRPDPQVRGDTLCTWRSPGFAQEANHPVVCVNHEDALAYVAWLSQRTRQNYRLLSEAEWEYAARGGDRAGPFWWGRTASGDYANYRDGGGRDQWTNTAPAGSFPANPFGLHDMHGNVLEWVQDCYLSEYSRLPIDGSAHESHCAYRVYRGGSWINVPRSVRSANRNWIAGSNRYIGLGFRVARTLD